ncbi:lys-63-specific deubiquitinase BRCC36-like protein [Phlyctochytrium arcticum]|nr:lys-63-specific deubiquitinase BRCC36-like protein [Phlyctochytrium arcticum]
MTLAAVHLSAEVYMQCLSYSLCTEKEETLALLLGDFRQKSSGHYAFVEKCLILTRKDKRKDRVEISDEQLSSAITEAEEAGFKVVGWSHSHPHITVLPSQVDIKTQRTMQILDNRFFGTIISCFNTDAAKVQIIKITCFQADDNETRLAIPLHISPRSDFISRDALGKLAHRVPQMLYEDECDVYDKNVLTALPESGFPTSFHAALVIRSLALLGDRWIAPLLNFCSERTARNIQEERELREIVAKNRLI